MAALPVVLVTAFPEALPQGERLDGYLAKPFRSLKLIEDSVIGAIASAGAVAERKELSERLSKLQKELERKSK